MPTEHCSSGPWAGTQEVDPDYSPEVGSRPGIDGSSASGDQSRDTPICEVVSARDPEAASRLTEVVFAQRPCF